MNPINLGNKRELFWDTFLVNTSRTSACLKQHPPQIQDIVMECGEPWEGDGCDYYSILKDGDVYRMYYLAWQMLNEDYTAHTTDRIKICYAESKDGIHWEKPNLNIVKYRGSGNNNIIFDEKLFRIDNFYAFLDTNPNCDPNERIKATVYDSNLRELWCFYSEDGIHFTRGWPITNEGKFDTQNVAIWYEKQELYYCYIRDFHDYEGEDLNEGIRDIRYITSPDFKAWSDPALIDFGDSEDIPLYTNAVTKYERAPQMLIGFPTRYVERKNWNENFDQLAGAEPRHKRSGIHPRYGLTTTDCVLMTSRDGKSWNRFDEAWMTPGIERAHNWVYGDCYPAPALIETKSGLEHAPDELSLYCFERHWSTLPTKLRRYSIRKDGFISYHATYAPQTLVTKPFTFSGSQLELNFSTSARGYIYVKIYSKDKVLKSCELFGNSLNRIVPFEGVLSDLAGEEVVIEFLMSDADLYSLKFT
jgi:hypothetical protein